MYSNIEAFLKYLSHWGGRGHGIFLRRFDQKHPKDHIEKLVLANNDGKRQIQLSLNENQFGSQKETLLNRKYLDWNEIPRFTSSWKCFNFISWWLWIGLKQDYGKTNVKNNI